MAKLYAHWITLNYRDSYNIFACSGILFNHESPLRGEEFVTRKISLSVARIKLGLMQCLELGNIDAKRDWGFASEYVDGMWRMLQADAPDNYVLATEYMETIRNFLVLAFKCADMEIEFSGSGVDEVARDKQTNNVVMQINPKFYRPLDIDLLVGNPQKTEKLLGWKAKTRLEELCQMMVDADMARVRNNL